MDFFLKTRVIEPPFVVSFGADPHGNLWDNWSYTMPQEIERAGNMVHLGMLLGDLTYAQLDSAEVVFPHFEKYAREFPVSFLHVFGNHDHVGGPPDNELVGHGAFESGDAVGELFVGSEELAQAHEGAHDLDVDRHGLLRPQHAGQHGHALLGEGVGRIPATAVCFPF